MSAKGKGEISLGMPTTTADDVSAVDKIYLTFREKPHKEALAETFPLSAYTRATAVRELSEVWFPLIRQIRGEYNKGATTITVNLAPRNAE